MLMFLLPRITSLRLIPKVDIQAAFNAATRFEEKAFRESRERVRSFTHTSEKLADSGVG
jgi:hypothetical protein